MHWRDRRERYPVGAPHTPRAGAAVYAGPSWLCCGLVAPAGGSSAAPSPHGARQNNRPAPWYPTSPPWGERPAPPAGPVTSAPVESGLRLGSAAHTPPLGLFFNAAS